jgi:hypothetical protein
MTYICGHLISKEHACGTLALLVTPNDCPVDGIPMDRKENVFMLVIWGKIMVKL